MWTRMLTPCTEQEHDSPHGVSIRVHGGRDQEIRLNVSPPLPGPGETGSPYLDGDDPIELRLEGFDLSNREIEEQADRFKITDDVDDPGLSAKDVVVGPSRGQADLDPP